jgi:hypothetical protein
LIEGELDNTQLGRVTGWIQFAGIKGPVVLNLRGNFHRDIQGAKIRFTGDARWESPEAIACMRGFSRSQNGKVGNITAGLTPADFGAYPFVEWYSEENGRVVIEPDRNHIEVIGQPVPLEQATNLMEFLATIVRSIAGHGVVLAIRAGRQLPASCSNICKEVDRKWKLRYRRGSTRI